MGSVIHVCLFLLLQVAASCCFNDFDSIVIDLDGKWTFFQNHLGWSIFELMGTKIHIFVIV